MSDLNRAGGDAVVVPAISTASSITCVRSLGKHGVRPIAASNGEGAPPTYSKYCAETVTVADPTTDLHGYKRDLLDLAERPDVRTVVPLREADIYVLARWRDEFAEHVETPWKPLDVVGRTQDRAELLDVARRVGVAVPETRPLDEWDRWDDVTVVKPRYSIRERDGGTTYPGVSFALPSDGSRIEEYVERMGHVPLAQEYLRGGEFGFFALFDDGTPVATFQHRRVRSFDYAGGASVYRKAVSIPELADAGTKLLREFDWHGPAMVEFKRDERDGTFKLMEINPRFWGSLALPVTAGVDFPSLYYRLATGSIAEPVFEYETGIGCHLLLGELSYLLNLVQADYDHIEPPPIPSEVYRVAASIVADPNFDYLDFDDPRPFVREFLDTASSLFPGR